MFKQKKIFKYGGPAFAMALLFLVLISAISCNRMNPKEFANERRGVAEGQLAKGFSIEAKAEGEWILSILDPWKNAGKNYRYRILKEGVKPGKDSPELPMIRIPVKRWIVTSTPHIAMMEALGALDRIVGFPDKKYIYSPEALASEQMEEVGGGEKRLNIEKIISRRPELCVADVVTEAATAEYQRLEPYGVVTVFNGDYLEETALARLEWIKVFGLLLDKQDAALRYFNQVKNEYARLKGLASQAAVRPTVFCGLPYKGVWYVPGGKSYAAQFIADAGGAYVFSNIAERGGVPLATEKIFSEAHTADFWLNASDVRSLSEIAGVDARFRSFTAFSHSRIYNAIIRINDRGGNDFYESGVVHPELILGDLCKIFHPELFSDRKIFFYRALP